jgi:S-formylglutathione hydrolase FrmB
MDVVVQQADRPNDCPWGNVDGAQYEIRDWLLRVQHAALAGLKSVVSAVATDREHDPDVFIPQLIDNNTRLWIYSPSTLTASDPASMIGYADQAQGSNRAFYTHYHAQGGRNAHVDLPATGDHGWSTWAPQLRALASDLAKWITR